MNHAAKSGTDLRLYVDATGVLWYGTNAVQGRPQISELSAKEFVNQDWVRNAERIRILGTDSNSELICELHANRHFDSIRMPPTIQLGTPAIITKEAKNDPATILVLMEELRLPGSCGGWHELSRHDYYSYALFLSLKETTDEAVWLPLLQAHPAYTAISFIPTSNLLLSAQLLATVKDPRWFIDPLRPNRLSRLRMYLGLLERNVKSMLMQSNRAGSTFNRAKLAINSWSTGDYSNTDENDPAGFLLRRVRDEKTTERGLLKASIMFLAFLKAVWLDKTALPGRTLFVPNLFFGDALEVKAYNAHVERLALKS